MATYSKTIIVLAAFTVGLVALAACQSESEPAATESPTETPSTIVAPAPPAEPTATPESTLPSATIRQPTFPPPPELDRSIASVEMSDIIFDRFDGTTTRLSSASNALIDRLRDAIKPVYEPNYEDPGVDEWLEPDDLVVGYVSDAGQAYAYPIKFLNFHELVNDEIDGVPVIITYCPLCGSGVIFDRRIDGETLVFGNTSALYNSDMVMFDHKTGSYWFQTGGEAVVGTLTGSILKPLASSIMGWGEWLEIYPTTKILSRSQGLGTRPSQYLRDPFSTYANFINEGPGRYPFPVDDDLVSDVLRPAEIVLAVAIGDIERAYPPGRIGDAAINDEIDGGQIVVFSRGDRQMATVFSPVLDSDDRQLEFEFVDNAFKDTQTGSEWNLAGIAVSGELEGTRLTPLPSRRAFWFSISISNQNIEVYGQ
ncbi:MAG: DUF3179 domain-containing protein [Dehalococcoidia bacterium]